MSTLDAESAADAPGTTAAAVPEALTRARLADVAGLEVRRLLPLRGRRTVGAWCFLDHYGPLSVDAEQGMRVAPHPHMGLQTVTWLIGGEVLHRDSLGSEQLITPGELNLMTAGEGIAHAEESRRRSHDALHGLQLWVALPDAARRGAADFEHHGSLPEVAMGPFVATVFLGDFLGASSPATTFSEIVGVEVKAAAEGSCELELPSHHEYVATVALGAGDIDGTRLEPGLLLYLEPSERIRRVSLSAGSRLFLLGGAPLGEQILMWWNFVARTPEEMAQAVEDWNDSQRRFGSVPNAPDPPLLTPTFDVTRLRAPR